MFPAERGEMGEEAGFVGGSVAGNPFARSAFNGYRAGDRALSSFRPCRPVAALAITDARTNTRTRTKILDHWVRLYPCQCSESPPWLIRLQVRD